MRNVYALRRTFLDSAARHNSIPGMDDNGFAALIAATIVSERRIGNVPTGDDPRNRSTQVKENAVASLGCIISGTFLKKAWDDQDWALFIRYLTNQEIPEGDYLYTLASVGIGNIKLYTAANLWKGQACSPLDDCTSVEISRLKTTNAFGWPVNLSNPFDTQVACGLGGACYSYQPTETESYSRLAIQLTSNKINIEYIAANLQAGALRAESLGITPTAFNSATWHLKGVQTDSEIAVFRGLGHSVGGAIYILDDIPTALDVMDLKSSWSLRNEEQYWRYR